MAIIRTERFPTEGTFAWCAGTWPLANYMYRWEAVLHPVFTDAFNGAFVGVGIAVGGADWPVHTLALAAHVSGMAGVWHWYKGVVVTAGDIRQ